MIQEIRAAGPTARTPAPVSKSGTTGAMRLGCRVRHETFGEGVVLYCEGQGSHARVQVNFEGVGTKWLVLGYARLQQM